MNIGIILAAGQGTRFRAKKPKQYMKINGREVIQYSIDAFKNSELIDDFFCVVDNENFDLNTVSSKFLVKSIRGGATRNESIKNALDFIHQNYSNVKAVFIHEAARPFINENIIDSYLKEIERYDAVVTAAEVTDSLAKKNGQDVERAEYHLIQAPECFNFSVLYNSFDANSSITSTSHQLPKNSNIKYIYRETSNLKVTYPKDIFLAEQILKYKYYRVNSIGNDFSKIVGKTALIFGGTGGVGKIVVERFKQNGIKVLSPSREDIDLYDVDKSKIFKFCKEDLPDIIINAAAYSVTDEYGVFDEFDRVFNVNLKANIAILDFAAEINKNVNVVLLSSSSSTRGRKGLTLYSASKCALNSVVESLSENMKKRNVIVNVLIPEKINTPLIEKLHKNNFSKLDILDSEEVFDAILHYSAVVSTGDLVHIRKGL